MSTTTIETPMIDLSSGQIAKNTKAFMSRLSEVRYDENSMTTTDKLVQLFREGFGFDRHNLMLSKEGILCFDMMICSNPLDKVKKQVFYTLFSQKEVLQKKQRLANVYQYCLDHERDLPDLHVDTMLQICYSDAEETKDGFYLDFHEEGLCSLHTLSDYKGNVRKLDKHRLEVCEKLLSKKKNPNLGEDIERIIKQIDAYCANVNDEISDYKDYVDAFLDKKSEKKGRLTHRQVDRNFYLISIINELAVPGLKYLYFIPIAFPNNGKIGHFVLSSADVIETKLINKFKMLAFVLMFPLAQATISMQNLRMTQREAVKSAVSAIMARNFKHNHGSHVLNRLASVDEDTFKPKGNYIRFNPDDKPFEDESVGQQRSFFVNYQNHRMGYHCDLSYGAPMLVENRCVFKEVFLELNRTCALLDHISGLEENFKYSISFEWMDKNGVSKPLGYKKDFRIAIPDGLIGTHAFYNIIENVVRNTAKHHDKDVDEFKFTVRFSDMPVPLEDKLKEEAKTLLCVEIFDNVEMRKKEAMDLVELQTSNANLPILKDGKLRSTALGMAEMEISACFLRQLDTYLINDDNYGIDEDKEGYYNRSGKYNLIKPIALRMGKKYRFGYRFFVRRPQVVLIVSDEFELNRPEHGFHSMRVDEFLASLRQETIYHEDFVVIHRTENNRQKVETVKQYSTSLSPRVLFVDDFKWLDISNDDSLLKQCWNLWQRQNTERWKINTIVSSNGTAKPNHALMDHHGDSLPKGILQEDFGYIEILSSEALRRFPFYSGDGLGAYLDSVKQGWPLSCKILRHR